MNNQFALITGATSGIGLEISKLLADRKYNLVLVSNQQQRLSELKEKFEDDYKIKVETMFIDLSNLEAANQVYEYCNSKNIQVEVLVNNAGFFFFDEVVESNIEKAKQMLSLHVITSSLLCSLFGKEMKSRKKGYILNNSSISAFKDFPGISYYGSSKSYIKSFTRSLRTEMKRYNVNVTCLTPGATATELYDPNVINVDLGKKLGIMMSAKKVAYKGVKGVFNDRSVVIPGFVTKVMMWLAVLTPHWILIAITKRVSLFDKKISDENLKSA